MGDGSYDSRSGSRTNNSPANAPIQGRKAGSDPRFDSIAGVFGPTTSAAPATSTKSPSELQDASDISSGVAVRATMLMAARTIEDAVSAIQEAIDNTELILGRKINIFTEQFDAALHSAKQTGSAIRHAGAKDYQKVQIRNDAGMLKSALDQFEKAWGAAGSMGTIPPDKNGAHRIFGSVYSPISQAIDDLKRNEDGSDYPNFRDVDTHGHEEPDSAANVQSQAIAADIDAIRDAAKSLGAKNLPAAERLYGHLFPLFDMLSQLDPKKNNLHAYRKDINAMAGEIAKLDQSLLYSNTKELLGQLVHMVNQ